MVRNAPVRQPACRTLQLLQGLALGPLQQLALALYPYLGSSTLSITWITPLDW